MPMTTSPRIPAPPTAAAPAAAADKPSQSAPATRRGTSAVLVRRGSQRSCCQNCHVPMSLCHCQKSACCICGLSAQNCSCVGIKAQPPPRPSSAAPRVPPRPSSAAQRCTKCAELAAQLSKAALDQNAEAVIVDNPTLRVRRLQRGSSERYVEVRAVGRVASLTSCCASIADAL